MEKTVKIALINSLKLPEWLYEAIEQKADREHRTTRGQLIFDLKTIYREFEPQDQDHEHNELQEDKRLIEVR